MPDDRIRSLDGSSALEPNHRQQFEGPSRLKFKVTLKRGLRSYQVIMQELDTNVETPLSKEFSTIEVAKAIYTKIVGRIMATHYYKVMAMTDIPQESIIFEPQHLQIWSFPNEE